MIRRWISNCVGVRNQKYFTQFLFYVIVDEALAMIMSFRYFIYYKGRFIVIIIVLYHFLAILPCHSFWISFPHPYKSSKIASVFNKLAYSVPLFWRCAHATSCDLYTGYFLFRIHYLLYNSSVWSNEKHLVWYYLRGGSKWCGNR